MNLPIDFQNRMKEYLGQDYNDFVLSYNQKPKKGARINTLKAEISDIQKYFNVFEPSPYSPLSFLTDTEKVGNMPIHSAGAFYSQEPSASCAVTALNPKKGDKVLDLCAAPGGKSTQIATLLGGIGLLWSNEIVKSRANILLSNMERMGVRNAVVSSCHPDLLCEKLTGFFDKVLVDAPCSGEGMFRKNVEAITEWSLEHVKACANRQLSILNSASKAVATNGVLVYSTCTFSKEENEDVCVNFLKENTNFILEKPNVNFGRKAMGIDAIRIYPMDGGEGHFVAKFRRISQNKCSVKEFKYIASDKDGEKLYGELFKDKCFGNIIRIKDKLIILPNDLPEIKGLSVLRAGVELGEVKKNRVEPSHNIFMCQKIANCKSYVTLDTNDKKLLSYLKGEEIECNTKGYTAVAVDGITVGFGKASNGYLKNKYPKGLRYL
ncbi:MAG: RsmB/NOP family class I SAM-dependent RNA methyltransferase [Clostridia bacterium]